MERVFPPGAVAEPRPTPPLSAAGPGLSLELGLDTELGPAATLGAAVGGPPDTAWGSSPEREPGAELTACLPLPCLGDLEKRECEAPPSAWPLLFPPAESLLCPGLALMFKGILSYGNS